MNLLKTYINNFIDRAGNKIFIATIFARLFSFLASWIALKLIPNKELEKNKMHNFVAQNYTKEVIANQFSKMYFKALNNNY